MDLKHIEFNLTIKKRSSDILSYWEPRIKQYFNNYMPSVVLLLFTFCVMNEIISMIIYIEFSELFEIKINWYNTSFQIIYAIISLHICNPYGVSQTFRYPLINIPLFGEYFTGLNLDNFKKTFYLISKIGFNYIALQYVTFTWIIVVVGFYRIGGITLSNKTIDRYESADEPAYDALLWRKLILYIEWINRPKDIKDKLIRILAINHYIVRTAQNKYEISDAFDFLQKLSITIEDEPLMNYVHKNRINGFHNIKSFEDIYQNSAHISPINFTHQYIVSIVIKYLKIGFDIIKASKCEWDDGGIGYNLDMASWTRRQREKSRLKRYNTMIGIYNIILKCSIIIYTSEICFRMFIKPLCLCILMALYQDDYNLLQKYLVILNIALLICIIVYIIKTVQLCHIMYHTLFFHASKSDNYIFARNFKHLRMDKIIYHYKTEFFFDIIRRYVNQRFGKDITGIIFEYIPENNKLEYDVEYERKMALKREKKQKKKLQKQRANEHKMNIKNHKRRRANLRRNRNSLYYL